MVQANATAAVGSFGTVTCTNRTATSCDCTFDYSRRVEASGEYFLGPTTVDLAGPSYLYCVDSLGGVAIRDMTTPRTELGVPALSHL
jgi:hypothetical protein